MSFYVDPWAYYCVDGAPEDSDEEAQEQNMTIKAEGSVDEDGNITEDGEGFVFKDCKVVRGTETCGYYEYGQGTSMASPHAAGVAALIVSRYGYYNCTRATV